MTATPLIRLVQNIRDILKDRYREKSILLFDLLFFILTSDFPRDTDMAFCRRTANKTNKKLTENLRKLRKHLDKYPIAQAICARYQFKQAKANILKKWGISPTDWNYVHKLAKEIGLKDFESFIVGDPFPFNTLPWFDRFEEDRMCLEVIFDPRALEDMLICTQEAYFSRGRRKRKAYEVYGINLGMRRDLRYQSRSEGDITIRYIHVMRSQPQLSAVAKPSTVIPNPYALEALSNFVDTEWPQYEIIGDFHSHPWQDWSELEKQKGWQFSGQDEVSISSWVGDLRRRDSSHKPSVSFVIAVAKGGPYKGRSFRYNDLTNTLQFTVGLFDKSCRIVIAGYRILGSGRCTDKNIRLLLPGFIP